MKLLQLNIEKGKYLDNVISYILKENYDLIHLQEVAGGKFTGGLNVFETLNLHLPHKSELAVSFRIQNDKQSYFGNATFYHPQYFKLQKKEIIWLKEYEEIGENLDNNILKDLSRNALSLHFTVNHRPLTVINTHLAWGPTPEDKEYKLNQGKILFNHVKSLISPFILSGDFNVTPYSQTIKWMEKLGVNHITKHKITNTLNPRLHRVSSLFPTGLAVDYVFTHPSLQVSSFKLLDDDLSDHFGLSADILL